MSDRYRTIIGETHAVLREKASRFIAYAFPIRDQEEFKKRVDVIAKEHHTSRHVCYAWVLGDDGDHQRANDAGEPAGTAGRPILNRILSANLTYTAVVVVRYFGGTLLGKAGLIKAYGGAAQMVLDDAQVVEHMVREEISITCTHAQFEMVKRELQTLEGDVVESRFAALVDAVVAVPKSMVEQCTARWIARGMQVR